jgi:hypothetical protein
MGLPSEKTSPCRLPARRLAGVPVFRADWLSHLNASAACRVPGLVTHRRAPYAPSPGRSNADR